MDDETLRLFEPAGEGRFRSNVTEYPGLAEAIILCLGDQVRPHRFGPTFDDPDAEMFWELTAVAEQERKLSCDLDLVRLALGSGELTAEELEAVARICNTSRLAMPDGSQDTMAWQLLTTVCSEATDALLG